MFYEWIKAIAPWRLRRVQEEPTEEPAEEDPVGEAQEAVEGAVEGAVEATERFTERLFRDIPVMREEYLGNEIWRYVLFGVLLFGALIGGRLLGWIITMFSARIDHTKRPVFSALTEAFGRSLGLIAFAFIGKGALHLLYMSEGVSQTAFTAADVTIVVSITLFVLRLVNVPTSWVQERSRRDNSRMDSMLVALLSSTLRLFIVALGLIQIVVIVSEQPPASVVASLGIGGLAVALAAQDSLSHFFGSIAIVADKPFRTGERIVVDGHDGPVEKVGVRSTRIRTLEGHLVSIPNGELAKKTIQNIGKRPHIRRLMNVTVTYDTPPEKVDKAVEIIKELLKDHEGMREDLPPRVYFNDFNATSLNILVIFWYHPPDYWKFMDFNERFNRDLLRRYNEEGIEFAFPTQTVFLAGDEKRPIPGLSGGDLPGSN